MSGNIARAVVAVSIFTMAASPDGEHHCLRELDYHQLGQGGGGIYFFGAQATMSLLVSPLMRGSFATAQSPIIRRRRPAAASTFELAGTSWFRHTIYGNSSD